MMKTVSKLRRFSLSIGMAVLLLLAFFLVLPVSAQGPLPFTEGFAGFTGSGFDPNPGAGQLDSDAWSVWGLSDGNLDFGDSGTSGDYARGSSTGGVTFGGVYAFDVGGGNTILGLQPSVDDFTFGEMILRLQNNGGATVTQLDISYNIWVYNDQDRANSLNFSYSLDDLVYTDVAALDFTTPEIADGTLAWSSTSRSTGITGISIADGDFFYLKWTGNDVSGSGNRDEYGIDDIRVTSRPALSISKTANPTTVAYHGNVTYTVVLSNSSALSATNALFTDTLPPEVDFARWVVSPTIGTLGSGDPITWTGTVSATNAITFTFVVTHIGDYGETVTNIAEYSYIGGSDSDDATFTVEFGGGVYLPIILKGA